MEIFITLQKDEIAFLQVSAKRCYMMKYAHTLPNINGGKQKTSTSGFGGSPIISTTSSFAFGYSLISVTEICWSLFMKKTDVLPGIYTDHVIL